MTDRPEMPVRTRDYQGFLLDSGRWDSFVARDDDIVITTAYKAGTTWMQTIVANLVFQDGEIPGPVMEISPWIDVRHPPLEMILETVEQQRHRRFLKTHLALDGLRFFPDLKYIYVGRDLRDVFMSMWNHHRNYSDHFQEQLAAVGTVIGHPWPDRPDDINVFWRDWITQSIFPWEGDGYPYWSSLHHLQTWWDYRHLPNILFVHYNDLLADPVAQMRRVAGFLDIAVPEEAWPRLAEAVSIDAMRDNAGMIMGRAADHFRGGGKTFINKGTNQRWRGVLGEDDLALYQQAVERVLDPAAAAWMESGQEA